MNENPQSLEPLQIADQCLVFCTAGKQHLKASIVARRSIKRKRDVNLDTVIETLAANQVEYYVHYIDHDRRLDEWVTLDKFQLVSLEKHPTNASSNDGNDAEEAARLTRRRSSTGLDRSNHSDTTNNDNSDAPFSLSGGNWHGGGHAGDPVAAAFEREHEDTTKVKNIEKIIMGKWEVQAWYYSPFPSEYHSLETLYVCEFCLTYMKKKATLRKHRAECSCRHPPGKEIYRENDLSVYELDGKEHRAYCQKLCLLAKLFLDHKTLYYDVTPFYFYVVTKVDADGAHIVGYFSKEKVSNEGYNLACILTFPQYQKAGYGKYIISLSYELTKREGKTGSPEKPLSDLGKVSYRSYWTHILMNLLAEYDGTSDITLQDMSIQTGIKTEDIISTLQSLDMVKVWKGQHVIYVNQDQLRNYMKQNKQFRLCNPDHLKWGPPSTTSPTSQ